MKIIYNEFFIILLLIYKYNVSFLRIIIWLLWYLLINLIDINQRIIECINKFRADPKILAELLLTETKNISVTQKNGKEIYTYKNVYCISGKEELFVQVSNVLKNMDSQAPLMFSEELALEPENVKNRKPVDMQDKLALQKEKDADYRQRVKNLKEKLNQQFNKIEILSHTTNEEIEDSIIMQIISNFNLEKNSKIKRPFDMFFGEQYKFIGVQLSGNKKMTGNIIFAF